MENKLRKLSAKEIFDIVTDYESKSYQSTPEHETGIKDVYLFKGRRRNKLVIIEYGLAVETDVIKKIDNICEDEDLLATVSDQIDLFTISPITSLTKRSLQDVALKEYQFALNVIDSNTLNESGILGNHLGPGEEKESKENIHSALFEYMSKGDDTIDVKSRFIQTLILFVLYEGPVRKKELPEKVSELLQTGDITDLSVDVNKLKRDHKIKKDQDAPDKNSLYITEEASDEIKDIVKDTNTKQEQFRLGIEDLLQRYGIADEEADNLIEDIKKQYTFHYEKIVDEEEEAQNLDEVDSKMFNSLANYLPAEERLAHQKEFINDIATICKGNDYLASTSYTTKFFNLYSSNAYNTYVSSKKNKIFLDTTPFMYVICKYCEFNEGVEQEWDNWQYQAMLSLGNYLANNKKVMDGMYISYDYINETVGEYKKALDLSWIFSSFEEADGLPTGNVFYSYYLFLKKNSPEVAGMSFLQLAQAWGFPTVNSGDSDFDYKVMNFLMKSAETYGIVPVEKIKERYDAFTDIENDYILELRKGSYPMKSWKAISNDVRQALFLTDLSKRNESLDIYLCTWDKSFYLLRDYAKRHYVINRSYAVNKPARLINRISLKYLKIDSKSISDEVFAYADRVFGVKGHMKSIMDNVLIPYFTSSGKKNSAMVKAVIKMEKATTDNHHEEEDDENRGNGRTLIKIFESLDKDLYTITCSHQDLVEFVNAEENKDYFLEFLKEALYGNSNFEILKQGLYKKLSDFVDNQDKKDIAE